MTDPIHFYSTADDYGELSNFAAFPIRLRGKTWPTSEHAAASWFVHDTATSRTGNARGTPAVGSRRV
jgi:N-glycosidase YbiA